MIAKGSLVRVVKPHGRFHEGKYLSVADRLQDELVVYVEQNARGKWITARIPIDCVKEVVA